MSLPTKSFVLKIYIGESARIEHTALYEVLVKKARETGLAGATVYRSPMGYGASSHIHSAKILQLSLDLPIVIEIVEVEEKLRAFASEIDPLLNGALVTLAEVEVLHHSSKAAERTKD